MAVFSLLAYIGTMRYYKGQGKKCKITRCAIWVSNAKVNSFQHLNDGPCKNNINVLCARADRNKELLNFISGKRCVLSSQIQTFIINI